jgi:hypothetical protein
LVAVSARREIAECRDDLAVESNANVALEVGERIP